MIKTELRDAVHHANKAFDWDAIPSGKYYQQRSIRRNQRRKRNKLKAQTNKNKERNKVEYTDWKDDPVMKAHKIF